MRDAAAAAERLPTRLDPQERTPLARLKDDLSGAIERASAALRAGASPPPEGREYLEYVQALFSRLSSSTNRVCAALDTRVAQAEEDTPIPLASPFEDANSTAETLASYVVKLRSGDELLAAEAFDELLTIHVDALYDQLAHGDVNELNDQLVGALWQRADALLLRELYVSRGPRSRRLLPAIRIYDGEAANPFRTLATLFASKRITESALSEALAAETEQTRTVLLRSLLAHPDDETRALALGRLRPADVWTLVSHPRAPVVVLRALFERFVAEATPEYLKVFFLCAHDRLHSATEPELLDAFRLLALFFSVEDFCEDVVFDRLLQLDRALRTRAAQTGTVIPNEARYAARVAEFTNAGSTETSPPDSFREVPLPIQRKLAREGWFLQYFVTHANERVAKETLPHLLRLEDVTRYLRVPTIHRAVIVGLCKRRRLLRKESARIALLHNPRTPAHAARAFVPLLSVEQLRQLTQDKAANAEVRNLASTFLARLKARRSQ